MFSCEFCETFKIMFSPENLQPTNYFQIEYPDEKVTVTELSRNVKIITLNIQKEKIQLFMLSDGIPLLNQFCVNVPRLSK